MADTAPAAADEPSSAAQPSAPAAAETPATAAEGPRDRNGPRGAGRGQHVHHGGYPRPPMGYGMYPMGMPYPPMPMYGRGGWGGPRGRGGAQREGHAPGGERSPGAEGVRPMGPPSGIKTNLYVAGLPSTATDETLAGLCTPYGEVVSAKVIVDRASGQCKGYGFVMLDSPATTAKAVAGLKVAGYTVSFAKDQSGATGAPLQAHQPHPHPHAHAQPGHGNGHARGRPAGDSDPTNLYFSNLPRHMDEAQLEAMIAPFAKPVSTRILRDSSGFARGVGFARMEAPDVCEQIISNFNGVYLPGCLEPLQVRLADPPGQRRGRGGGSGGGGGGGQRMAHMQPQHYWPPHPYSRPDGVDPRSMPPLPGGPFVRPGDVAHPYLAGMMPPGGVPMHPLAGYPPGAPLPADAYAPPAAPEALAARMDEMRLSDRPSPTAAEGEAAAK